MLVEADGLTKRYGSFTALANCSFGVARGEVFGLLGPNGAGKTTLLRLLMGFLRPTAGRATIDGLDVYRHSAEVHRRVAYLPGDVRLFRRMRGHRLVDFFVRVRGGRDLRRSRQLAERLNLDLSQRIATMSTGMRQKLALVVTLSPDVPVIILDEPTSNLDPSVRRQVMAMVCDARREGRTVILSSHVLPEVEETCDRVAILRSGQMVATQVMAQLRRQHRIRAKLTGDVPPVPERFRSQLSITTDGNSHVLIDAPGEMAPLFGWLATLPLEQVTIEPVGLRRVYEEYHRDEGAA
jgi:ABC-2 type transport system ATP-binding protein